MAYSIFDDNEKNKLNDKFSSISFNDFVNQNNSRQNEMDQLNNDIELQNKALEDIIANQQKEENQIREDYDSLGSRAGRFLNVLGAGLRGENASAVAQAQREDLNKRLQNAQSRYKDQRDSTSTQLKDLLNRKDALDKSKYERERDLVKDQQAEKEYQLKDRQVRNQERQVDYLMNQGKEKEKAGIAQAELENKNNLKNKVQSDLDIATAFNTGTMTSKSWKPWKTGGVSDDVKGSALDKFSMKLVKDNLGIDPKDYFKFKKENPDVIPVASDDEFVIKQKLKNIGYNPVKRISEPDKDGKQIIEYEDGSLVVYDSKNDDYIEVQ